MLPPCATVFERICQRCTLKRFAAFCKPESKLFHCAAVIVSPGIVKISLQPVTTVPGPVPIIVLTLPAERIIRTRFNCITLLGMPYYISPIAIVFLVLTLFSVLLGGLFLFVGNTNKTCKCCILGFLFLLLLSFFLIRILPVC